MCVTIANHLRLSSFHDIISWIESTGAHDIVYHSDLYLFAGFMPGDEPTLAMDSGSKYHKIVSLVIKSPSKKLPELQLKVLKSHCRKCCHRHIHRVGYQLLRENDLGDFGSEASSPCLLLLG